MQLFYSFLQDSLDLGHDDLQRTLQQQSNAARSSNGHVPSPHAVDLNPMEFIEQNHGAGGGSGGSTGNPNAGPAGTFYYYLLFFCVWTISTFKNMIYAIIYFPHWNWTRKDDKLSFILTQDLGPNHLLH